MDRTRSFKVGTDIYDIPESKAQEFLNSVKDKSVEEILTFDVDKDKYDIPVQKVKTFLQSTPFAKPSYDYPALDTLVTEKSKFDQYNKSQSRVTPQSDTFRSQTIDPNAVAYKQENKEDYDTLPTDFGTGWKSGVENLKGGIKYLGGVVGETIDKLDGEDEMQWDNRLMESARKNFENAPRGKGIWYEFGTFAPQMIGIAAATATAPLTAGTSLAVIPGVIGGGNIAMLVGSASGSAMYEYDRYMDEKGEKSNSLARLGVGIGSGAAEYLAERIGLDRYMPKGSMARAFSKFLSKNTDVAEKIGKEVVQKAPLLREFGKKTIKNAVEEGSEEVITEIGNIAIESIYRDKDDIASAEEIVSRLGSAFKGGAMMGGVISPLTFAADRAYQAKMGKNDQPQVPTVPPNSPQGGIDPEVQAVIDRERGIYEGLLNEQDNDQNKPMYQERLDQLNNDPFGYFTLALQKKELLNKSNPSESRQKQIEELKGIISKLQPANAAPADPMQQVKTEVEQDFDNHIHKESGNNIFVNHAKLGPIRLSMADIDQAGNITSETGEVFAWDPNSPGNQIPISLTEIIGKPVIVSRDQYLQDATMKAQTAQAEQVAVDSNSYTDETGQRWMITGQQDEKGNPLVAMVDGNNRATAQIKPVTQDQLDAYMQKKQVEEQPVPEGEQKPAVKTATWGNTKYQYKSNPDGTADVLIPNKVPAAKAFDEISKHFANNTRFTVVPVKEKKLITDPNDEFADPVEQEVTTGVKIVPKEMAPATPDQAQPEGKGAKTTAQPQQKQVQASYSFGKDKIDRDEAVEIVNLAERYEDIKDLKLEGDAELDNLVKTKFPPAYTIAGQPATPAIVKANIRLGKNLDQITVQNDSELSNLLSVAQKKFTGSVNKFSQPAQKVNQNENKKPLNSSGSESLTPEELAENSPNGALLNAEIEKRRAEDPDYDNKMINSFLDEINTFNNLSTAQKKRYNLNGLNARLGAHGLSIRNVQGYYNVYQLIGPDSGPISRKRELQSTKQERKEHPLLTQYDEKTQGYAQQLFNLPDQIWQLLELPKVPMNIASIRAGIRDIKEGKRSNAANNLLDNIEQIVKKNAVTYKPQYGQSFPDQSIDEMLDFYLSDNELNDEEIEKANQIPEDIADAILTWQALTDEQYEALYSIDQWWGDSTGINENKDEDEQGADQQNDEPGEEAGGSENPEAKGEGIEEPDRAQPKVSDEVSKAFDKDLASKRDKLSAINKRIAEKKKEFDTRAKNSQKDLFPKPGLQEGEIETPIDLTKENIDRIMNPMYAERDALSKDIDNLTANRDQIIQKEREKKASIEKAQQSLFGQEPAPVSNPSDIAAKKADIERRRQEELFVPTFDKWMSDVINALAKYEDSAFANMGVTEAKPDISQLRNLLQSSKKIPRDINEKLSLQGSAIARGSMSEIAVKLINAKYDAELAALTPAPVQEQQAPEKKNPYSKTLSSYANGLISLEEAKDYTNTALAGLTSGRGFNQSYEDYLAQNPQAKKRNDDLETIKAFLATNPTREQVQEYIGEKPQQKPEVVTPLEAAVEKPVVKKNLTTEKELWEMTRDEFIQEKELKQAESNKLDTPTENIYKVGDRYIEFGNDPYVFELRNVNPNDIDYSEKWQSAEAVLGRDDVQQYIKWFKEGKQPMPISVVFNKDRKEYISSNRRRLLAARNSGVKTIPAWVEVGKHRDLIQQALSEGKPVPENILKDYPELKKQEPDIDNAIKVAKSQNEINWDDKAAQEPSKPEADENNVFDEDHVSRNLDDYKNEPEKEKALKFIKSNLFDAIGERDLLGSTPERVKRIANLTELIKRIEGLRESPKEYRYKMLLRPFGISTHPKEGFVKADQDPEGGFQILTYDRKLDRKQWNQFSLLPITEIEEIKGKGFKDKDGEYTVTLKWENNNQWAEVTMQDKNGDLVSDPYDMSYRDILENIQTGYWIERKPTEKAEPEIKTPLQDAIDNSLSQNNKFVYERVYRKWQYVPSAGKYMAQVTYKSGPHSKETVTIYSSTAFPSDQFPRSFKDEAALESYKKDLMYDETPTIPPSDQEQQPQEPPKKPQRKSFTDQIKKGLSEKDGNRLDDLRNKLRNKLGGQLNAGLDPETFILAAEATGLVIKSGARQFKDFVASMVELLGNEIKPFLKGLYEYSRRADSSQFISEMTPTNDVDNSDIDVILKQLEDNSVDNNKEEEDVFDRPGDSKQDSPDAEDSPSDAGDIRGNRGGGRGGRGTNAKNGRKGNRKPKGGPGLFDLFPPDGTEQGGQNGDKGGPGDADPGGNGTDGTEGLDDVEGRDDDAGEGAEEVSESFKQRIERVRKEQRKAENIQTKLLDADNIRETLPFLLPEQQDDVIKAETRFFGEAHTKNKDLANGKGMLFTNGTGTGKTYTGLGIIKRFVKMGKGNVLIVVPSQPKVNDWIVDGRNLNLDITALDGIKDGGKGIVITTYANFSQNDELKKRDFDLVIYDESHRLMEEKNGTASARTYAHYDISNRFESDAYNRVRSQNELWNRIVALRKEIYQRNKDLNANMDLPRDEFVAQANEIKKLEEREERLTEQFNENVKPGLEERAKEAYQNTKVVFLSATPFKSHFNLRYANGILFDWGNSDGGRVSAESKFFLDNFGAAYEWKYNQLQIRSRSDADAVAMNEVEFSEKLMRQGVMSGRAIESPMDYERSFPLVSGFNSELFNRALSEIYDYSSNQFDSLRDVARTIFHDYNYSTQLFESLKASMSIDRMKAHLDMGRKVVVFHRRQQANVEPPFESILRSVKSSAENTLRDPDAYESEKEKAQRKLNQVALFTERYSQLLEYEQTLDYRSAISQIKSEFGNRVAFVNGTISTKEKNKAIQDFNKDDSGIDIIVVQEEAGKEGISLHDTTGNHQRVIMSLSMPNSSTTALQIEGRIYRIGNASDAIFEYPLLGLDMEINYFGQNINKRLSTTENLAIGNSARDLIRSFAEGVLFNSSTDVPSINQGKGGKEYDRAERSIQSDFQKAVLVYRSNQKTRGKRDQREGIDYFATPEPIGQKMVEWLDLRSGDAGLEPSAGHGAIAMWFPNNVALTAVEPSFSLFSRLNARSGGGTKRILNNTFESLDIVNKYNGIAMNPPFGTGGKTAMDHVEKAFIHLKNGGRLIAIVPAGPSMDKRVDKFFNEEDENGKLKRPEARLMATIELPGVTFEQAGTSVMSKILVIDRVDARTEFSFREEVQVENRGRLLTDRGSVLMTPSEIAAEARKRFEAYRNSFSSPRNINLSYIKGINELFESIEGIGIDKRNIPESEPSVTPQRPASNQMADSSEMDVFEQNNSRTGEKLYMANFKKYVTRDGYLRANKMAEKYGGYFSKYENKAQKVRKGFLFKTEKDRADFLNEYSEGQDFNPMQRVVSTIGKKQQFEVIQSANPAQDDIHTWIRDINEIQTLEEAIKSPEWNSYEEYNPDWTAKNANKAIRTGKVTVYSSKPIEAGTFVTPSKMEAQSYSGDGKVYSQEVNTNDVAWIDPTQGQYAPAPETFVRVDDMETIRGAIQNLQDKATNAKPLFMYSSDTELNQHLDKAGIPQDAAKKVLKDGKTIGFYDEGRGVVFIDLRKVGSVNEGIATWVHEMGIHAGLRNIIPAEQFDRFMEEVYDLFKNNNKTYNEKTADNASRTAKKAYDLVMGSSSYNEVSKAKKGEEMMAYFGERYSQSTGRGDTNLEDKGIFKQIVEKITNLLRKVFGLTKKELTLEDVELIVKGSIRSMFATGTRPVDAINQAPSMGKLRPDGKTEYQISNETEYPLSEKEFYKKYKGQHKDIRSKGNSLRDVQQTGFKSGAWVLPIYKGGKPTNIVEKTYGPKKGDFIYIVPKEWVKDTPGGWRVKEGWKPQDNELVEIAYDNQPIYEAYTGKHNGTPDDFTPLERAISKAAESRGDMINVDGVMRPTTNSQGNPIAQTLAGIRNFYKWFGDSKVVDDQGRPLVVYHGTQADFDEFTMDFYGQSMDWGTAGKGYYFTDNSDNAGNIARNISLNKGESPGFKGESVMPLYLSIKNPFYGDPLELQGDNKKKSERLTERLKSKGYDGFIGEPIRGITWFIAFDPSQIKSATGNNGNFDPDDFSILRRTTPTIVTPLENVVQNAADRYAEDRAVKRTWNEVRDQMVQFWKDVELPIKRLQEAIVSLGGKLTDNSQPYRAIDLAKGRLEHLFKRYIDKKFNPLLKAVSDIRKMGISGADILPYMISKHALERNPDLRNKELNELVDKFKKSNPKATLDEIDVFTYDILQTLQDKDYSGVMPFDQDGKGDSINGFTNPEELAQAIVDEFEARFDTPEKKALLKSLWDANHEAGQETLKIWKESNSMSEEEYQEQSARYNNFVPLRGWREGPAKDLRYHKGQGFGKSLQHAEGRTSLAENPLAYMESVAFKAISEQVDNEVRREMLNLLLDNWKVKGVQKLVRQKQAYYIKVYDAMGNWEWDIARDPVTDELIKPDQSLIDAGEAKVKVYSNHEKLRTSAQAREHEVWVRTANMDVVLVFDSKNKDMLEVAHAFNHSNTMFKYMFSKNVGDANNWNKPLAATIGILNNWQKAMYTSFNVVFPFTNFGRDVQEGTLTQWIKGESGAKVLKNYKNAFPAIVRGIQGKTDPANNKYDELYERFYMTGGPTGYTHSKDIQQIERELEKTIKDLTNKGTIKGTVGRNARHLIRNVETWNRLFEDATRFSIFMSAVESGKTDKEAASMAKEATVNFNRKGKITKAFDSVWAFFNVSLESMFKNFGLARKYPARFAMVAGGYAAAGFFVTLMNDMLPGDDDDDYYNVSDYARRNYLIIPNIARLLVKGEKGDKYLRLPLPQFWRGFYSAGSLLYDVAVNKKETPLKAAGIGLSNFMAGLLPVDVTGVFSEEGVSFSPIAPTVTKPVVEMLENRNFMNQKIYNEPFTLAQQDRLANAGLGKSNVNQAIKFFTDLAFIAGGGEKETYLKKKADGEGMSTVSWWADWNPSKIEHILKGYSGGTGGVITDAVTTAIQFADPNTPTDFRNMPFINAFIRKVPEAKWGTIREYQKIKSYISDYPVILSAYRKDARLSGNTGKYVNAYRNPFLQEYLQTIKVYDNVISNLAERVDYKTGEGMDEMVKVMNDAINKVNAIKEKYDK